MVVIADLTAGSRLYEWLLRGDVGNRQGLGDGIAIDDKPEERSW